MACVLATITHTNTHTNTHTHTQRFYRDRSRIGKISISPRLSTASTDSEISVGSFYPMIRVHLFIDERNARLRLTYIILLTLVLHSPVTNNISRIILTSTLYRISLSVEKLVAVGRVRATTTPLVRSLHTRVYARGVCIRRCMVKGERKEKEIEKKKRKRKTKGKKRTNENESVASAKLLGQNRRSV